MTLTTAGPPPAGIYWQAVINTSANLTVEPDIVFREIPDTSINLSVQPKVAMLPPQPIALRVAPMIAMSAGTKMPAAFSVGINPSMSMGNTPDTAFSYSITPALSMTGGSVAPAALVLNPTVGLGISAVGHSAVAYDATGAGYTKTTTGSTVSATESHTATAGAAVIVAVTVLSNNSGHVSSFTRTAKYGSSTMTSLGVVDCNNSTYGWVELFGLKNVSGGAQTVTATVTGGSPSFLAVAVNSVSYLNVGSFGTAVTNYGSTTSPSSGSVSSASGQRVVQAFATVNVGTVGTQSGYTQTSRWAQSLSNGSNALHAQLGDAAGASTVTFGETLSAADYWGSVAVPLIRA